MPLELFRAPDGAACYLRRVVPARPRPLARLVVLPGVRSHGGWYGGSADVWAAEGFEVVTLDRRGTGLNTARRGDAPGFRRLIDDVAELVRAEHAARPWLPTFVVGISWGGKLAAALPYRHPWLAAGLVLVTPGLRPKIRPPLARRLRILAARLLRPRKLFPIPLNEPDLFTASPEWRAFLAANPHDLREATARFLVASTMLDVYLRRAAKAVRLPVLTLLAGRDRIIDNPATREFLKRFPSPDATVIEYPDAEHTLEFEGPACPFAADVAAWVRGRLLK